MKKQLRFTQTVGKALQIREMGVLVPILIAVVLFAGKNPKFLEADNVINMLRTASFNFLTAIGMTFLIISGGLDLSVGAVYALAGVAAGIFMNLGIPIFPAILFAILCGAVIGLVNGFFVEVVSLPPFLATMGSMYLARGLVLGIQKGNPIYPLPDEFNAIGQGSILQLGSIQIPTVTVIALLLGVVAAILLRWTTYGRMLYAVGGNAVTARLAGIPVRKVRFSAYLITSILASSAGILVASRMATAQPNVGSGYEMNVIAACVIGGVSLNGGAGSIVGALLGSVFMTMISNGMTLIRVSAYWQQLVTGVVLLLACSLDQIRLRLKK